MLILINIVFYISTIEVREEEELSKTGVLKHVKDIIVKIRKVTEKLAKVSTSRTPSSRSERLERN